MARLAEGLMIVMAGRVMVYPLLGAAGPGSGRGLVFDYDEEDE